MKAYDCVVCGEKAARIVNNQFDSTYNQIPVHLENVKMYECGRCGESTLSAEQNRELTKKIKALVRERLALLPPEKIVSIRDRYGLSQEALEGLLGLGQKVVTRWERGIVLQSQAADVVLQLMDRLPEVVDELRKIRSENEVPAKA